MVETYQQAIQWAVRAIGRDNAFPALSDWEWWKELARDKTVWGRLAKKAYKRYVAFHLRQDQVESWHGAIFTACLKHTDQQHPQVLKKEFHVCILCSKAFSTPQGWFLHAHGKHGYRSREGQAAQGTYCFCTYDTVQDVVPFSTVLGRKESNSMRRHAQNTNKCLGIGRACSNSHRDDQKLTKMF